VFWGNAVEVLEPRVFLEEAGSASRDKPPIKIWVNFLPASLPNRTPVVHTIGMSALDYREIVLVKPKGTQEGTALVTIEEVTKYVVRNSFAIRAGDKFNVTPTEAVWAEEIPAPWDPSEVAILLAARSSK
jgi:hypothetical protein